MSSRLDQHAEALDQWLLPAPQGKGLGLEKTKAMLAARNVQISVSGLWKWWDKRSRALEAQASEEKFLERITRGAQTMRTIDEAFKDNPDPHIEALLRNFRLIIADLTVAGVVDPEKFKLIPMLMGPVMDYAKLTEKRREIELAESKYRDHVAAQKAALERELGAAKVAGGLTPETLEKIERELKLL
jgi:hypothetical protein